MKFPILSVSRSVRLDGMDKNDPLVAEQRRGAGGAKFVFSSVCGVLRMLATFFVPRCGIECPLARHCSTGYPLDRKIDSFFEYVAAPLPLPSKVGENSEIIQ